MFKLLFLILCVPLLFGCQKEAYTSDGLHIFRKGEIGLSPPSYTFKIKGGERHLNKIDWGEDDLPTSAKSCHHGGEVASPQKGVIKAVYNDRYLYLDISWDDKTKDIKTSRWKLGKFEANKDDGISIVFSKNPSFTCAETCHMSNWKVEEGKFYSDYRMFSEKEKLALILLRAEKTKGKPLFAYLQKEGKKNEWGEELFILNSKLFFGKVPSFQLYQFLGTNEDTPQFPNREEVFIINEKNRFLEGALSFGFNRWHARIEIPLELLDINPVKGRAQLYMAVAVFDGTQINHSMSETFKAIFE